MSYKIISYINGKAVLLTAAFVPLYTGSDCSAEYAVALDVMTMLPSMPFFFMLCNASLMKFKVPR